MLKDFIERADRSFMANEWLKSDEMEVYVRRGRHVIYPGKISVCLDIATINVHERRQGIFSQFVEEAHALNPWEFTYIENVLTGFLIPHLVRNNWTPIGESDACFYKPKDIEKHYDRLFGGTNRSGYSGPQGGQNMWF